MFLTFFSPSTPPGTKLKIVSKVQVVGGFVLLKPGAVQVCGGIVEHMIKKWNLQKVQIALQHVGVKILAP